MSAKEVRFSIDARDKAGLVALWFLMRVQPAWA
jgi:hypothetical protein